MDYGKSNKCFIIFENFGLYLIIQQFKCPFISSVYFHYLVSMAIMIIK